MSKLFVDQVDPKTATTLTLGTSGDTITVPSGAELKSNKLSPASSTALQIGDSGDTITIPAGATIANSGTATGFGESNTPYFKAYTSGSTQQGSSGAYTDPVLFATEMFDSDSAFASSIFTVPAGKGGKYFFHAQIEFYQNMYDCYLLLVKNSTNVSVARNKRQTDSSLWNMRTVTVSTILDMAAGDTMKAKVYAETSDSDYNIFASETSNYFEGFRIAT